MNARQWGRGDRRRLTTKEIPAAVLALVDERQGGRFCVLCRELGIETPSEEPLQIDHRQPLSEGGDNHHLNLRWLCRAHNCGRGSRKEAEPRTPTWARKRREEPEGLVVLLRGIPGAGKSTYARSQFPGAVVLGTDRYFSRPDGSYRFEASRLGAAHEACLRDFRAAVAQARTPIVVDKCNLTWRAIEPYVLTARGAGYELRVVTLLADPATCWRRNQHDVPRDKVFELARILDGVRLPAWIPTKTVRTEEAAAAPAVENARPHPFRHWPTREDL